MFAIDQRFRRLEEQINLASNVDDEELSANLSKFGTVLICGFVERSVEVVVLDRLSKKAHPRIINFVKSYFKRGTNYNCNAICQLLERFDPSWRDKFVEFMNKNEKEVDALSSTYNMRNRVAHGDDANISSYTLKERCLDAKKVIDALIVSTRN